MKNIAILAALASIFSFLSATASADNAPLPASAPRLPSGWIRGGDQLERLPPQKRTSAGGMQEIHEFSFRTRPTISGGQMDIAALPVIAIEPPPSAEPPRELPAPLPGQEDKAADVIVLKKGGRARVSVRAIEAGVIQVGKALPNGVGRQSEGGAAGVCGPGSGGIRPFTYEGLRRIDDKGSLELLWGRGFLDAGPCRVAVVERHTARPKHIGGGVVYAFRTRCPGCAEGARDVLHVLTPQMAGRLATAVPFEHRTLPLAPGKSGAFEGSSSFRSPGGWISWSMPDWHGFIDRQCKEDTVWCSKGVRLEVSQSMGETAATVFIGGDVGM